MWNVRSTHERSHKEVGAECGKKVTSSHSKGESTFISEEKIDMEKMREAIEETGYHFISMESEPYEKKRWFGKR